jgi:hypothetical protein
MHRLLAENVNYFGTLGGVEPQAIQPSEFNRR